MHELGNGDSEGGDVDHGNGDDNGDGRGHTEGDRDGDRDEATTMRKLATRRATAGGELGTVLSLKENVFR